MPAEEGLDSKSLEVTPYFFVCFEYKPKHYKKNKELPLLALSKRLAKLWLFVAMVGIGTSA